NARVGIHPNQRSMRVWHAAKSTLNARMACCQINAECACRHSAGLKTPPTRRNFLKLTLMGREVGSPQPPTSIQEVLLMFIASLH
ncbi:hypothetical protein J4G08_18805, partial [Candidatus Poribacteria bacterium]|nr:hypothetical protein [Candidatus Poribacteria bacterium]